MLLGVTVWSGLDTWSAHDAYAKAQAACVQSSACGEVSFRIGTFYSVVELIGNALVVVPALVGAFWGAPLISREIENGTYRLVWTQSVTRTRCANSSGVRADRQMVARKSVI